MLIKKILGFPQTAQNSQKLKFMKNLKDFFNTARIKASRVPDKLMSVKS